MTTTPVDALHTQTQMQVQEVQLKQRAVGSLANGGKSKLSEAEKEKKLRESCEGFESIFIQKMWQQMRATVPKENPLQGREEQFWQGMYDQELSKKMASSGGIGLADMMYDQLSRNLVSASRTTASALGGKDGQSFAATAAPLLPAGETAQAPAGNNAGAVADAKGTSAAAAPAHNIYAGAAPQPEGQKAEGGTAVPADGESSPVVQQFLAELRQKQTAAPEVITRTQVHGQGVSRAIRAQQAVANRPAQQGVMPAMQAAPAQTQPTQANPALAQAQGQASAVPTVPGALSTAAIPGAATMQPTTAAAAQGSHAPAAQNAMQLAPQQAAPISGEALLQAQLTAAAAQPGQIGQPAAMTAAVQNPGVGQVQGAATQPAAGQSTGETPAVVNTTFTTNVPPKRRSTRPRGQRLPSGQPLIRTLGGAPASPITTTAPAQTAPASQAVQNGQISQAAPSPTPGQIQG